MFVLSAHRLLKSHVLHFQYPFMADQMATLRNDNLLTDLFFSVLFGDAPGFNHGRVSRKEALVVAAGSLGGAFQSSRDEEVVAQTDAKVAVPRA